MTKVTEIALEDDLFTDGDADEEAPGVAPATPAPARRPALDEGIPGLAARVPAQPAALASRLMIVATALAVFASATSIASVVIAGRATARAGDIMAGIESDRARADRLPRLIERMEAVAVHDARRPVAQPVSDAALRAALGDLRQDLVRYAGNSQSGLPAIRDAQRELANRLAMVIQKLNRIDERLARSPAHP